MNERSRIELVLPMRQDLVSILQRCVEESARAFGLDKGGCMRLMLAAEEVYAFLLQQGLEDESLSVTVCDGGAHVEVRLSLSDGIIPMESFNQVPRDDTDQPGSMRQGLFLAARSVSSLEARSEDRKMVLSFSQNKTYDPVVPIEAVLSSCGPWTLKAAGPVEANQLAARVASRPSGKQPSFVLFNGKASDLVSSGNWGAFVALDPLAQVGAGVFWEKQGKTAFLHGPWSFCDDLELAGSVLNKCLGELSRMNFDGVCIIDPTPETPLGFFEPLGQLPIGSRMAGAYYRLLGEDEGCALYVHPSLEKTVSSMVDDLFLPRAIHQVDLPEHSLPEGSALSLRIDPEAGKATLSVLFSGRDGAENLKAHLDILSDQGIEDVSFALDLGISGDAIMGDALLKAGFVPRILLPWAGRGDVLILTPSGR